MGCHFLLQEIFPTQGLNPGLPHCRQMLYLYYFCPRIWSETSPLSSEISQDSALGLSSHEVPAMVAALEMAPIVLLVSWLLLLVSRSGMSSSLQPHGLQHARPPLSLTVSCSLLRFMSIETVMPSNHLVLCCPLPLLP